MENILSPIGGVRAHLGHDRIRPDSAQREFPSNVGKSARGFFVRRVALRKGPFVKHGGILNQKIFGPSGVIGRTILAGLAGGAP